MSEGPSAGQILAGIFLILCGLCITLVGGGCTILWIGFNLGGGAGVEGGLLFLVSLATLAVGVMTLWVGAKMLMGRYSS